MMRKQYLLLILLILLMTAACAGLSDWSVSLPNDYEVWHIHANEILIKYVGSASDAEEIPSFVKEFAFQDQYVFTRNIASIQQNNILSEKYYVLDTRSREMYGCYDSLNELCAAVTQDGISMPQKWYRTSPMPEIADSSTEHS